MNGNRRVVAKHPIGSGPISLGRKGLPIDVRRWNVLCLAKLDRTIPIVRSSIIDDKIFPPRLTAQELYNLGFYAAAFAASRNYVERYNRDNSY